MMDRRTALPMLVLTVFLTSALSFYAGAAGVLPRLSALIVPARQEPAPAAVAGLDSTKMNRILNYIQQEFVDPVSAEKLNEGALKGMVEATGDKYSSYYTTAQFKKLVESFKPSFSGIGVYVEMGTTTKKVTIVAPIKGSPGEAAGLKRGDIILKVDDKDIADLPLDQAVDLIRGPRGTKVKLTIQRDGAESPLDYTITRATVEISRVEAKMIDPAAGVGYMQITEFNEQVGERASKAMADLKSQGMTRLILDLRGNPGGLLDEAINVASLFVPAKQPVVHIVSRTGPEDTRTSRARNASDMPLVVLVDGGSASASEIVAGAIKDLKLGVLIGEKTFGKGSVQSFYNLPDGSGVKLTTAKYLTAGKNSIHEKGIEADIVIKNDEKVRYGDPGDTQLEKAIQHIRTMKR